MSFVCEGFEGLKKGWKVEGLKVEGLKKGWKTGKEPTLREGLAALQPLTLTPYNLQPVNLQPFPNLQPVKKANSF